MNVFKPKIIAFLCNWCAYDGADAAGRSRLAVSPNVREIRLMCSGQVSPGMVLKAFEAGADGVLIMGCAPGDCHYKDGNLHVLKRTLLLQSVLDATRIQSERLRLEWVSAGQGERYAEMVHAMVESVKALGPLAPETEYAETKP